MTKLEFCESFIYLKGRPISLAGRPHLIAPYQSQSRRLVIRASRQVEKTTLMVNIILHTAVCRPGSHIIFVCPRAAADHRHNRGSAWVEASILGEAQARG